MAVPHSSFHLYNQFVTLKDSIFSSSLLLYYFSPHFSPSFLTLQYSASSSLSRGFATSVSLLLLLSRLFNPFLSIQLPILLRGSHYIHPPFLPFCTTYSFSLYVCPREKFVPIRVLFCCIRQLNEEATVTWKMACLYLPTNVFCLLI